ncbi:glycosyltransferase family 2 protein [Streptomyces sp. NPDC001307]|uniref:glycosyltransferase family 2 protein n=1 Tax=Streptomyces sp. NPDC001307 TaxID=3364560 RepID=UPI0036B4F499
MSTESATGLARGAADAADARITVAVITRDRPASLLRTLDALAALPERPPVIVVDNSRDDSTRRAVRTHPAVTRLLRPAANTGALGRNLAVRHARTAYVAFSDDDSWWEPGSLGRAADLLDARPRLAALTARIVVEPDGTEDPVVRELRESPLHGPDWLPGPALGSFRAGGGFHPGLWLGGEEELLACDLQRQGWWLAYAEDLTVHHQASRLRDSTARRVLGIRNTLWFTWLRRPLLPALRRTGHLMRTVPRDIASAHTFAHATAGLPWVLRQRDPVPPELERRLAALERARRTSPARRYVG